MKRRRADAAVHGLAAARRRDQHGDAGGLAAAVLTEARDFENQAVSWQAAVSAPKSSCARISSVGAVRTCRLSLSPWLAGGNKNED